MNAGNALRKSDLIGEIAREVKLSKAAVGRVLERLTQIAYREAPNGFVVPGIGKLKVVRRKPSRHRNPVTGQLFMIGERMAVKMTPLKKAKRAMAPNPGLIVQPIEDFPTYVEPAAAGDVPAPAAPPPAMPGAATPPSAPAPGSGMPPAGEEGQVVFPCPECGTMIASPIHTAGQKGECPNCRASMAIPERKTGAPALEPAPMPVAAAEGSPDDYILFRCRACSQEIEAPRDMIGMSIECPACGSALKVPLTTKLVHPPETRAPGKPAGKSSSITMRIDLSDLE